MKPILFNTDMVRAILDGRKTQTRRVVNTQLNFPCQCTSGYYFDTADQILRCKSCDRWFSKRDGRTVMLPQHCTGDILYVRETWMPCASVDSFLTETDMYTYKADWTDTNLEMQQKGWMGKDVKWRPSIHMPKEAARLFLRVTDVRIEQLQDISEEDAITEGIFLHSPDFIPTYHWRKQELPGHGWDTARTCFLWGLWASTIKDKSTPPSHAWKENPWVWVYEFEVCEKNKE